MQSKFISYKIKSFIFSGKNKEEAYLKGCTKLAKYIASNKYDWLSIKIEKVENENAFEFSLYTNLDLTREKNHFCKMCKETHCLFFINEEYNCNRCNLETFFKRMEEKSRISKGFYLDEMKNKEIMSYASKTNKE